MTMLFTADWNKPKLTTIPSDAELLAQRVGLSNTKQKKLGIHSTSIDFAKKNNQLRLNGVINSLLSDMLRVDKSITIDQGTHQAEDVDSGGFMLHFNARDSASKCFHLYVGQNNDGTLKIIEISYMDSGVKKAACPTS